MSDRIDVMVENEYKTKRKNSKKISILKASCIFYPRFMSIVFKSSYLAKRGKYTSAEWIKNSQNTLIGLEKAGVEFSITGLDHLRSFDGPVVYVANHMSTLETFILPMLLEPVRHCTFIAKKNLVTYPVFGNIMRSLDPVLVTRENPRQDLVEVLTSGVKKLHEGTSIIVFPQSTRDPEFGPEKFNSIGVKLARRAGVPIIPIALKTDAWGNAPYRFIKDYGKINPGLKVHFAFDAPLEITGNGNAQYEYIVSFIQKKLAEWKKEDNAVLTAL